MTTGSGKMRLILGVDPGSTIGVALLEPVSGVWRAGQIACKGAYLKDEGTFDGVMSDGAEMYLDEMAGAKECLAWATGAIKDIELTLRNAAESGFVEVDGDVRVKSDASVLMRRWADCDGEAWVQGDLGMGDLVVIEDFLLRAVAGKGSSLGASSARSGLSAPRISLALVSWLEIMEWDVKNGVSIKLQSASNAKGVIKDERLKALGGWIKGAEHARDAMRHVLLAAR